MTDYLDKNTNSSKNTDKNTDKNTANDNNVDQNTNSGDHRESNSSHVSHWWMLILCSLIMVVGFLAISGRIPWLGSSGWMIVLLCPLMHFAMMFAMKNDSQG